MITAVSAEGLDSASELPAPLPSPEGPLSLPGGNEVDGLVGGLVGGNVVGWSVGVSVGGLVGVLVGSDVGV